MVGGRLMGMGADDEARPPIDEMRETHLLAGRLGMEVDHHRIGLFAERAGGKLALARLERIVEFGMHEHTAHDVGHHHARTVLGQINARTPAGCPLRKIGGPQEPVFARREIQRIAVVPDVIAGGHDIGARRNRRLENLLGDAETAGRVLAVDDDEIQFEL